MKFVIEMRNVEPPTVSMAKILARSKQRTTTMKSNEQQNSEKIEKWNRNNKMKKSTAFSLKWLR